MADQNYTTERLDRMQRDINEWKTSVSRRKTTGSVLMVIFVLFMAGYLYFAYSRVSTVQANEVVLMVEERFANYIDYPESDLTKEFEKLAPPAMEKLSALVIKAPEMLEEGAYKTISEKLDSDLPALEKHLTADFQKTLLKAREEAKAAGKNVDDPAVIKEIIAEMTDFVTAEMSKTLDTFYNDYSKQSADMINYIDMLAQNQNLDPRASMHRELLLHFFALVQKYKIEGTPDLVKGVKSQM